MTQRSTLNFLRTEAAAGLVLVGAALLAVIAANSPWAGSYRALIASSVTLQAGAFEQTFSVLDWVNQGLMAIFFFVVGMELKFEVVKGELSSPRRLALPILASAGGATAGALAQLAVVGPLPDAPGAWITSAPTDLALALVALSVVGRGLPGSLRLFVLTVAISANLIALLLGGILFTEDFGRGELVLALFTWAALALLGRWRSPFLFYAVGFLILWGFTLKAGVPTSLAGLAAALTVPASPRRPGQDSVLKFFLDSLHPYVAFGILPLFAFCAAGFSFRDLEVGHLFAPLTLAIIAGLVLAKPAGVFAGSAVAIGLKLARKPTAVTWPELLGASLVCGAGFTFSLYFGAIAFPAGSPLQAQMRLGVIAGSVLASAAGMALLSACGRVRAKRGFDDPPDL
jgi:Na+:H+ antiporter, NhaA family